MAFVTFKQFWPFFLIIAILAALTTANSLSDNRNERVDLSEPTPRKGDDALIYSGTENSIRILEDTGDEAGPRPGKGHAVPNTIRTSNAIHEEGNVVESRPSPGEGHGVPSVLRRGSAIHKKENMEEESRPSRGKGHGFPSPMETKNTIYNMEETDGESGSSPGEGYDTPRPFVGL